MNASENTCAAEVNTSVGPIAAQQQTLQLDFLKIQPCDE